MSLSISTSYVGQPASEFLSLALFGGKTIEKNLITLLPNIKYSEKLQLFSTPNLIQADSATWNATGTDTISERSITPVKLKINHEIGKNIFENSWEAAKLRTGAQNNDNTVEKYFLEQMALRTSDEMEYYIWQADSSATSGIVLTHTHLTAGDGLVKKALADANVIDVTATTLSASNILTEVGKVYDAIPSVLLEKPDLKIFVSHTAGRFHKRAMATATGNPNFNVSEDQPLFYLGIEVVPVQLATNVMYATCVSNIFYGTDMAGDMNEVSIIDFSKTTGADQFGYKSRFSVDVNHAFGAEVVLYS